MCYLKEKIFMNQNQIKLGKLLTLFEAKISDLARKHPSLFSVHNMREELIRDPETDRLKECIAYMLAQVETNLTEKIQHRKNNDLSNFLEEWFEPLTSSIVLKAKYLEGEKNALYLNEGTKFYYHKNFKQDLVFSNALPIQIQPLEIEQSYFEVIENSLYCVLHLSALEDIKNIKFINLFFDQNKFSNFYRLLDEFVLGQKNISLYINEKLLNTSDEIYINYSFRNKFDLSVYKNSNYTHYLHQFCNYLSDYSFLDIELSNIKLTVNKNDKLKFLVKISENISEFVKAKNFAFTNSFTIKNSYIKRGDPLYLKNGRIGFFTLDRASKKNFISMENIQFFDREHNDVFLKEGSDYKIYKKHIVKNKQLDIIYYFKLKKPVPRDLVLVPYFKCSNLTDVSIVPLGSKFKIRQNNCNVLFESLAFPTKTHFSFENFNSDEFYKELFIMNDLIMRNDFYIVNFFKIIIFMSDMSKNYRGLIEKILEQVIVKNEKNEKKYLLYIDRTFLSNRYSIDILINRQVYSFGGVSIIIHFLDEFLKKVSYVGFDHTINITR